MTLTATKINDLALTTGMAISRAETALHNFRNRPATMHDAASIVLLEGNIARTRAALRGGNIEAMGPESDNLRAWVRDLENA